MIGFHYGFTLLDYLKKPSENLKHIMTLFKNFKATRRITDK